jgi:hypothetical protein
MPCNATVTCVPPNVPNKPLIKGRVDVKGMILEENGSFLLDDQASVICHQP